MVPWWAVNSNQKGPPTQYFAALVLIKLHSCLPEELIFVHDGTVPLAEKIQHIPRVPGVNTLCPTTNLQRLPLLPSCLQNDAKRIQTVKEHTEKRILLQDGSLPSVFRERTSQSIRVQNSEQNHNYQSNQQRQRTPTAHCFAKDFMTRSLTRRNLYSRIESRRRGK